MKKLITTLFAITISLATAGENLLKNGDFEKSVSAKDFRGFDYIQPAKQQFVTIDKEVKHSGNASVRISGVDKTWVALIQHSFKMEDFKKPIVIRGWAKYENLITRFPDGRMAGMPMVGLWTTNKKGANGPSIGIPCFAEGSKDWFQFEQLFTPESVRKRLSPYKGDNEVVRLSFRINVASQSGTIWFDDLEFIELEEEALKASLPVADVSATTLKVNLTVATPGENTVVVLSSGGKQVSVKATSATTVAEFPIGELPMGKNTLLVEPKEGFPPTAKPLSLTFNRIADAFDEE